MALKFRDIAQMLLEQEIGYRDNWVYIMPETKLVLVVKPSYAAIFIHGIKISIRYHSDKSVRETSPAMYALIKFAFGCLNQTPGEA
jgi:hypothetical protein